MKEVIKRTVAGATLAAGSMLAPHIEGSASGQDAPSAITAGTIAEGGGIVEQTTTTEVPTTSTTEAGGSTTSITAGEVTTTSEVPSSTTDTLVATTTSPTIGEGVVITAPSVTIGEGRAPIEKIPAEPELPATGSNELGELAMGGAAAVTVGAGLVAADRRKRSQAQE